MHAIITFHSIDDDGSVLSFSQRMFARLLEALASSGLPVCELDTLLEPAAPQGVALTFDDGMASVFTHGLPVLRDFAVPAHLFLTTGAIGRDNRWSSQPAHAPSYKMLEWGQIEALHAAGVRIESHTASHPDLRTLGDSAITGECATCNDVIAHRLGRRPRFFAYPYGYHDQRVRDVVRRQYAASVTTELRSLRANEDRAALPRLDSYYLRSPRIYRRLSSPPVSAYLTIRHILRRLRGNP